MDILVISTENADRVERFQHFVAEKGHPATRIRPGAPVPTSERNWLGAVVFDQGSAPLPDLLRGLREPLRYLSIPMLIVTAQVKSDSQEELRTAGADLICDAGTPDALILKELQTRCLAQPVAPELRAVLAEPLIVAVRQALADMTAADVVVRSVYQRSSPAALGDISAVLELSSPLEGVLILSFSTGTAAALEKRVLAEISADANPALLQDCMGEIANVVAGQAKALLGGTPYHFKFSSPLVSTADQKMNLRENLDSLTIAFDSDLGGLALQLCRNR